MLPVTTTLHAKRALPVSLFRAFTLIELLTVIAIIGILAGIMIPVVGSMRESARSVQCLSNLKQIHTALALYAEDNRGFLPKINENNAKFWFLDIMPYYCKAEPTFDGLKNAPPIQVCETQKKNMQAAGTAYLAFTYGMNSLLSPNNNASIRLQKLGEIPLPSRTLLVTEAPYNATSAIAAINAGYLEQSATVNGVYKGGVHKGANHFLWCDGHVTKIKDVKSVIPSPLWYGGPNDHVFAPGGLQYSN